MKISLYQPQAIHELGKRDNQEDAIYPKIGGATDKDRIFILCDGMGGHEKGEVASNTVSKALAENLIKNANTSEIAKDNILLAALEYAYEQLDKLDDGATKKMGTTLCLLLFHRGGLTAMHIGDSRIYHIRPSEHRIVYQSKDHSLVYDLYQAGEITYDEMKTSPQKNIITRAIQPGRDNRVRPSIVHITDIQPDDYFYICSDGMLEQMENNELCNLLSANGSDNKKRQQLIAATADNSDNHSAYLIHINNVAMGEDEESFIDDEQTSSDNAINIKSQTTEEDEEDEVRIVEPAPVEATPIIPPHKKATSKKPLLATIALAIVVIIVAIVAVSQYGGKKEIQQPKPKALVKTPIHKERVESIKEKTPELNTTNSPSAKSTSPEETRPTPNTKVNEVERLLKKETSKGNIFKEGNNQNKKPQTKE